MKRKRYVPFGYKLTISYLLFVIIPFIIIGYYAYTITLQSVREQTTSGFRSTLGQIKDNIEFTVEDLTRVSDQLYLDQNLQDNLRWYKEGWSSYDVTTNYLIPKLVNAVKSTGTPIWLSIYLDNGTLPEIIESQDTSVDPLTIKAGTYEIYHMERIADQPWYKELPLHQKAYDPTIIWRQVESDTVYHNISLLRRLDDAYEMKQIGLIRITLKISDLLHTIDVNKLHDVSHIVVFDDNHHFIYQSGVRQSPIQSEWKVPSDGNDLKIEERIPGVNWNIVAYIPNDVFQKDANKVRNMTTLVCACSFMILAMFSFLVSRLFARRVRQTVSVLNAFQEGDFHARINDAGNDEFAQIASALNKMGQNTDQLIREVYITKIQKREAELTALQAQINPHFLYNTLSSISRLAQFGQIDKLQEMVLSLAKFYRLTLNEGRLIISIDEELQQAKAYIDIQKIKYKDRLDVIYQIETEVLEYDTIKLILQPFIENVIEHSWFGDNRIHLKLSAYQHEGNIVFKIIDDGIGIHPKTIHDVFDKNGIQVGYGIRNVDERIKLQFGDSYGVTISSKRGIGTSVQIVIPASKRDWMQDTVVAREV